MRYMFTMMNNARLVGRARGPGAGRAGLPDGARATPRSASRAGPPGAPAGEQSPIVDHPDVRRMLLTHAGLDRGACGRIVYANAGGDRPRRPRTPTRPTRDGGAGAGRPAHARLEGVVHRPRRRGHRRSPSRSTAAWATSRRPASPSTTATPASRRSTRAPTASRPWTSSAASCRCAPAASVADYLGYIDAHDRRARRRRRRRWRRSATRSPSALAEPARRPPTGCSPTASADPLDALAGATPYLRLFGLVTGGWVMARQALTATRGSWRTPTRDDKAVLRGQGPHRPLLLRADPAPGGRARPRRHRHEPRPAAAVL